MQYKDNPWQTHSSTPIYQNPWIKVREDKVTTPAGTPGIYSVVEFQNHAVGVVAIDDNDQIVLVGQYRYPLQAYSWEIPEGGCPKGEDPAHCAIRELKEETGLVAEHVSAFMQLALSNSSTDDRATVFIATGLTQEEAEPEDTEDLQVIKLPFSEALAWVNNGKITDAISVAAILRVQLMRLEQR